MGVGGFRGETEVPGKASSWVRCSSAHPIIYNYLQGLSGAPSVFKMESEEQGAFLSYSE